MQVERTNVRVTGGAAEIGNVRHRRFVAFYVISDQGRLSRFEAPLSRRRLNIVLLSVLLCVSGLAFGAPPASAQGDDVDVYGPATFVDILDTARGTSWTPVALGSIANRDHVVLIDAATQTHALTIDDTQSAGLTTTPVATLSSAGATYGQALRSMFQLLDNTTEELATEPLSGTYRLHPELLSYFAVDADALTGSSTASGLTVRDRNSYYAQDQTTIAYLAFTFSGTPSSTKLRATRRYMYNAGTEAFELDGSWSSSQWLVVDSGGVSLTPTVAVATAFIAADATDLVEVAPNVPSDFNPASTAWQTNSWADYPREMGGAIKAWDYADSRLYNELLLDVDPSYQTQFGADVAAATAASQALDAIETSLAAEGSSLRYSKSVYLAYRDNALRHLFGAHDVYNAALGERTVAHVYFTNAQDDLGVHHPFMVIASHDASGGPNFLVDVARPPGDGTPGLPYESQTITRRAILENKLVKIPLKDYGLVAALADNDLAALGIDTLAADAGLSEAQWTTLNHAGNASTGIAIDGAVIYPASNNTLSLATSVAEVTSTGIHVGRGLGLHYHADGHGFTGNGINLYNLPDYVSHDHPPMVGFAYDGVALFGKYETSHSSMAGAGVALDAYGGHSHGDYGYHYHAFAEIVTDATAGTYTQNFLLVGAWRGDVNDVPGLVQVSDAQLMDEAIKRYAGATGTAVVTCATLPVTINMNTNGGIGTGTAGDDVILGTADADVIAGEGGDDTICAGAGDDQVRGGPGADAIYGESGADDIRGGGGNDAIFGADGDDEISGQGGGDTIAGGGGDDTIDGQGAADVIAGDAGDDTVNGQNGADQLDGGSGADDLRGQTGPDTFDGGDGDDSMLGGDGADTFFGGSGFDKCSGNTGPDSAEATTCEQTPGIETFF